jgi:hypothetical protein
VRALLDHRGPFGVGLRLSAQAAKTLEQPEELNAFRRFLRDGDYYVLTIKRLSVWSFSRAAREKSRCTGLTGARMRDSTTPTGWRGYSRSC